MVSTVLNLLKLIATILSGLGKKKKLFILIYHRVLDEPDFMRPGEVDKEVFSWQMELLAKYFNVLPLAGALERMRTDTLPSRAVCITFDDGYADNYLNALPILQKNKLKATFFIANGYLNGGTMWNDKIIETVRLVKSKKLDLKLLGFGEFDIDGNLKKTQVAQQIINTIKHLNINKRQKIADDLASRTPHVPTNLMMTDDQLVKLYQAGMEIGGHTVTHPIMAHLDQKIIEKELQDNKHYLEQLLNTTIRFFAYPNGKLEIDYKQKDVTQVKLENYQAAVSTQWGVVDKNSDLFQLPRFTPWDQSPCGFMLRMILRYKNK